MDILLGAAGAVLFFGAAAAGAVLGWKGHARYTAYKTKIEMTADEVRLAKERDDAFQALHGYSVETAYNLRQTPAEFGGDPA